MNVVVFGAGAMGTFLAAKLRYRLPLSSLVALVTSRPSHRETLLTHEIKIITHDQFNNPNDVRIGASTTDATKLLIALNGNDMTSSLGKFDLAIIMTKGIGATRNSAAQALALLRSGGALLSMQNGIGYAECITEVISSHDSQNTNCTFIVGSTTMGIRQVHSATDGVTLHQASSKGYTVIAEAVSGLSSGQGSTGKLKSVLEFCDMDVTLKPKTSAASVLWTKLVVSASLNPVTALTRKYNGYIFENGNTDLVNLLCGAVIEVVTVANALNIELDFSSSRCELVARPALAEKIKQVCKLLSVETQQLLLATKNALEALEHVLWVAHSTYSNISSMLSDVQSGRRTEADSIIVPIINHAERLGIPVPLLNQFATAVDTSCPRCL